MDAFADQTLVKHDATGVDALVVNTRSNGDSRGPVHAWSSNIPMQPSACKKRRASCCCSTRGAEAAANTQRFQIMLFIEAS